MWDIIILIMVNIITIYDIWDINGYYNIYNG
jgi:hypothetical protein